MSTTKDLARVLAMRNRLSQRAADNFLTDMIDVIKDALAVEGSVKVKGLGTFRMQMVRERESVDVNTGKRVVIASHGRVAFTPDATIKESVNKPFAHFETVILNDGVNFDDTPEENENEIEETVANDTSVTDLPPVGTDVESKPEPVAPEPVAAVPEPVAVVSGPEKVAETIAEPVMEPVIDTIAEPVVESEPKPVVEVIPAPVAKPIVEVKQAPVAEPVVVTEPTEEPAEEQTEDTETIYEDTEETSTPWLKWLGCIAAALLIFVVGLIVGRMTTDCESLSFLPSAKPVVEKPMAKPAVPVASDTTVTKVAADTIKPVAEPEPVKEEAKENAEPAKSVTAEAPKEEKKPEAAKTEVKTSQYDSDPRVRTGAWRIVGVKTTVTVNKGQTLKSISRSYLGPDMECYVEAINGGIKEVTPGQKVKIPELKNKKALK